MAAAPLDWIVLKVMQTCNLDCTYCYVYNRGDDSWKSRPPVISDRVVRTLAERIRDHCQANGLTRFVVEFHGGEPLLIGKQGLRNVMTTLRDVCAPVHLKFLLQTNGTLLDEEWVALFDEFDLTFGISIDGPPEIADRRRIFRRSRTGSTMQVLANVEKLRTAGPSFERRLGGVLCVIDPAAGGAETVRWFVQHGFQDFEFLLPDGTYNNLPPDWDGVEPYRRFLIEAFDEWYDMGARAPSIRFFETMIEAFMGVKPSLDALGGDLTRLCVVESDGSIGVSDVVRICGGKYSVDGINVFEHALDDRRAFYAIDEIQAPAPKCSACPYLHACGGGYLPHRFDGQSFDNPSLYCDALYGLAERIGERMLEDVPATLWASTPERELAEVTP